MDETSSGQTSPNGQEHLIISNINIKMMGSHGNDWLGTLVQSTSHRKIGVLPIVSRQMGLQVWVGNIVRRLRLLWHLLLWHLLLLLLLLHLLLLIIVELLVGSLLLLHLLLESRIPVGVLVCRKASIGCHSRWRHHSLRIPLRCILIKLWRGRIQALLRALSLIAIGIESRGLFWIGWIVARPIHGGRRCSGANFGSLGLEFFNFSFGIGSGSLQCWGWSSRKIAGSALCVASSSCASTCISVTSRKNISGRTRCGSRGLANSQISSFGCTNVSDRLHNVFKIGQIHFHGTSHDTS
mmetsp:Transcript_25104/g.61856  ORF Transcript_25104/g.61856 Transcript_25104/m.61856 type:complete len:296 (-) Transcript_25104:2106-2993(-)